MIWPPEFLERVAQVSPHGPDRDAAAGLAAHLIIGLDFFFAEVVSGDDPIGALREAGLTRSADALRPHIGGHLDGQADTAEQPG